MYDFVAQLVEHFPFKEGVLGSNPSKITFKSLVSLFFFCFFSCSPEKSNHVALTQGVFAKNEVLSLAIYEEKQVKKLDKKILDFLNDPKSNAA